MIGMCGTVIVVIAVQQTPAIGDTLDLVLDGDPDSSEPTGKAIDPVATEAYGAEGSWEGTFSMFGAAELGITEFLGVRAGVDWFVAERFSLGLQLDLANAWVGGGDSTVTIGLAPIVRWHFLHGETWTVFGELGSGVAWNGSPIPANGTRFVFTPQAALGATFEIAERTRLRVALGWFHMSNARTSNSNPGLDGVSLVAGFGFSF